MSIEGGEGGTHDYGSVFCVPLIGGSGGAGGQAGNYNGALASGGGGGGGAILIASAESIAVGGSVDVRVARGVPTGENPAVAAPEVAAKSGWWRRLLT